MFKNIIKQAKLLAVLTRINELTIRQLALPDSHDPCYYTTTPDKTETILNKHTYINAYIFQLVPIEQYTEEVPYWMKDRKLFQPIKLEDQVKYYRRTQILIQEVRQPKTEIVDLAFSIAKLIRIELAISTYFIQRLKMFIWGLSYKFFINRIRNNQSITYQSIPEFQNLQTLNEYVGKL